jgi:hypothetical protein
MIEQVVGGSAVKWAMGAAPSIFVYDGRPPINQSINRSIDQSRRRFGLMAVPHWRLSLAC